MTQAVQKETLGFQAEVKQLLNLMIHSLYSNKEIFLRELVSNASDASDKLRFLALSSPDLYEGNSELKIWVEFDKAAKTITVRDNGIGMNREEIVAHLGTIAKSGTKEFLKNLSGDQSKDSKLIGQFGVGFYSAFVVADHVDVMSRKAGAAAGEGVHWSSKGDGEFTVESISKDDRGTTVILHLKDDADEFLNDWRLRNVVQKYSDHISLPILMRKPQEMTGKDDDKPQEVTEFEVVNKAKALWALSKSEITDDQYKEFYKHVSSDFRDPLLWMHNKVEGTFEYTSLVFIPSEPQFDLYNREQKHGLKLYTKQVFIMDEVDKFLPMYLRFVRGVIDADLPLNVSREILQENKLTRAISTGLVKRVLKRLEELASENSAEYQKFWKAFGNVLKEGPGEDFTNKEAIAKLLRFASTQNTGDEQTVSFADYISRMKPEQKAIYFLTGESHAAVQKSPHLEMFKKKGIEVLLLTDRIDEWLVSHLTEFDGKPLQSIAKGNLDLGDLEDKEEKEKQEKAAKEYETMLKQMKEVLGDRVKEVRATTRLTTSPACVSGDEHSMALYMQQMMKMAGQELPATPPYFEVNIDHKLIQRLHAETDDHKFKTWTEILFDQAILAEGGQLKDPAGSVHRLNEMLLELVG